MERWPAIVPTKPASSNASRAATARGFRPRIGQALGNPAPGLAGRDEQNAQDVCRDLKKERSEPASKTLWPCWLQRSNHRGYAIAGRQQY
jgi:hypothetical protein